MKTNKPDFARMAYQTALFVMVFSPSRFPDMKTAYKYFHRFARSSFIGL